MRIAIVTDAWLPQVNGVVTTLSQVVDALRWRGDDVQLFTPSEHPTVGLPTYSEIRLAVAPYRRLAEGLSVFAPDAIHIATEGPLGHAARRFCRRRGLPFTTAYHTRYPQYVRLRAPIPQATTYAWLRRFHRPARRTLVPTPSIRDELADQGFRQLALWPRGVDTQLFHPSRAEGFNLPRPVHLYAGRVACEKNLEAFLAMPTDGSKVVVGDGPDRELLASRYPNARFTGYRWGEALAATMASADVFVFPSRTDTYGLTMLEAMACGVPVAAHPVGGPRDIVTDGVTGALEEDLASAAIRARQLDPAACVRFAQQHTWDACANELRKQLAPIDRGIATLAQAS
jgi:glycosyltransferase involved in cell wall biosynthesis